MAKKVNNVFQELQSRGLIAQTIFPEELERKLTTQSIKFYVGFDPTADSLHIGHMLMLIVANKLQQAGHQPIFILGGGTGLVGDPSGRTEMRKMLSEQTIVQNCAKMQKQMSRFISFSSKNAALFMNNAQ